MKLKQCIKCGDKFPATAEFFYRRSHNVDGLNGQCKKCANKWITKNRKNKPKLHKQRDRKLHLKYNFGMTIEEYDQLFEKQNGVCAICGQIEKAKNQYGIRRLAVDHNHLNGKIRGLVCTRCNNGLGNFKTDEYGISLLLRAINYLGASA